MVEIPCDCSECLRMLCLHSSNSVTDDVTRRCRCCPRWNVNNDDDCIWELSGCIERMKTNWQQFNVWATYPLLNGHIAGVNPSLIKKQDNDPAFPLTARTPVVTSSSWHLFGSELAFPIIPEGGKGLYLHLLLSLFAFRFAPALHPRYSFFSLVGINCLIPRPILDSANSSSLEYTALLAAVQIVKK